MESYKWFSSATLIAGGVFILSFLWNGVHNRPAHDDFEFLAMVSDLGIIGSVAYYYDHWNTRWAAILAANLFYHNYENTGTFLAFHVITLVVWYLVIYNLVRNIFRTHPIMRWQLITLTTCSVSGLFFATFNYADSYYWVNTSAMYHWNLVAFAFFVSVYLGSASPLYKYAVALVTGLYIGGAGETFVVMASTLLLGILSLNLLKRTVTQPALLLTFLAMILSGVLISYLGQGHEIRSQFLPATDITFKFWVLVKSMVKFMFLKIPSKLAPLILFSTPWYFAGNSLRRLDIRFAERVEFKTLLITAFLAVVVMALITFAPLAWLMSEMGPERAWNHLSWVLYMAISGIFFYMGNHMNLSFLTNSTVQKVTGSMIILYTLFVSTPAVLSATAYSNSWDERIETINKKISTSASDTILIENRLVVPEWLHSAEISSDPAHFTNQHLKRYLKTSKEIRLSR